MTIESPTTWEDMNDVSSRLGVKLSRETFGIAQQAHEKRKLHELKQFSARYKSDGSMAPTRHMMCPVQNRSQTAFLQTILSVLACINVSPLNHKLI